MTTDDCSTALVPLAARDISAELHRIAEQAQDDAEHALAPATLRQYAIKFAAWSEWATRHGFEALPADPAQFALYLSDTAWNGAAGGKRKQSGRTGQSISTLRQAVAAIVHHHRQAGLDDFNSKHRAVRAVLAGLSRKRAEAPIQAKPLDPALLGRILEWLAGRDDPWSVRDAALLSLGYSFARRRSELAGLDLEEQREGDGFLARFSDRLEITLVRHKTAGVGGEPLTFPIPRGPNAALIAAIDRWIAFSGIRKGTPLLRRIDRHENIRPERIEGDTIGKLVKRRIKQFLIEVEGVDGETAKADAAAYSGHSLRTGLAVAAANAGADIRAIQTALGHASPAMSARYAAKADALKTSVHNKEGVSIGAKGEGA